MGDPGSRGDYSLGIMSGVGQNQTSHCISSIFFEERGVEELGRRFERRDI